MDRSVQGWAGAEPEPPAVGQQSASLLMMSSELFPAAAAAAAAAIANTGGKFKASGARHSHF
jgi:hypothetical protein